MYNLQNHETFGTSDPLGTFQMDLPWGSPSYRQKASLQNDFDWAGA